MIRSLFLALTLVAAACGSSSAPVGETGAELSANGCHYRCNHCGKDQLCAMYCVSIGNCGATCVDLALCIQGYHWDDRACKCAPDTGKPTEGPCTSDRDCRGGDLCCYPCGVEGCANTCLAPAPGGGCPLFP